MSLDTIEADSPIAVQEPTKIHVNREWVTRGEGKPFTVYPPGCPAVQADSVTVNGTTRFVTDVDHNGKPIKNCRAWVEATGEIIVN